jgi:hypothetical protein
MLEAGVAFPQRHQRSAGLFSSFTVIDHGLSSARSVAVMDGLAKAERPGTGRAPLGFFQLVS